MAWMSVKGVTRPAILGTIQAGCFSDMGSGFFLGVVVSSGRVIRFNEIKGYGFISPDSGGEDVFLHVNDLLIPESQVHPGAVVEFELEDGDRGPKASSVRLSVNPVGTAMTSSKPVAGSYRPAAPTQAVGDDLCDVLNHEEFIREVTELLLRSAPTLTGVQIVDIRGRLLQFGTDHGWIES